MVQKIENTKNYMFWVTLVIFGLVFQKIFKKSIFRVIEQKSDCLKIWWDKKLGLVFSYSQHIPEDPVFGTRYYLCFFIFFFDGSTGYQMQLKKNWKIFCPQKRGFSTGLNTQKNFFLNFFWKFLGDLVPWY